MNLNAPIAKFSDVFDLVGRLCIAFIFCRAAIRKIIGFDRFGGMMEGAGVPPELLPLVIALEIFCALSIALGWNLRFGAILLAGFTALATLLFHMDWEEHFSTYLLFSKNVVIFGGLLVLAANGAGRFSLDHKAGR